MIANLGRIFLCSLLGPLAFCGWAQQSASSDSMDTSTQVAQSQSTWQPSTRTPDGLPVCQAAGNTPDGLYRVGRGVLAPIPKYTPIATPSEEARRMVRDRRVSKFPVSLVGLIVDEKGRPKNICILREVGYGLDKQAFDTVARYRFDPATLRGKPVPVRVVIEVNFDSF
jgi:hypothetical protein